MSRNKPATLTMRNSSKLLLKIAKNLKRSMSGLLSSEASSRTRPLNLSQLRSRWIYLSLGSRTGINLVLLFYIEGYLVAGDLFEKILIFHKPGFFKQKIMGGMHIEGDLFFGREVHFQFLGLLLMGTVKRVR